MTQGREKGSVAEREVAALLEAWWRQLEPECRFVRTPLSGGWGGPQLRAGFRASGDLMTTAAAFPFVVESKRREAWSWGPLLAGRPSPIWAWWRQTQVAALEMAGEPMMWFRHNRKPWHVMLPAMRLPVLPSAVSWVAGALAGVDYGEHLPAITAAQTLLGMEPRLFADGQGATTGGRRRERVEGCQPR